MDAKRSEKNGLSPLNLSWLSRRGLRAPRNGMGPVFAVPKLLAKTGLRVEDIGLWELTQPSPSTAAIGSVFQQSVSTSTQSPSDTPLRRLRLAPHRPCADRRQAVRRETCSGDDVHRRRYGERPDCWRRPEVQEGAPQATRPPSLRMARGIGNYLNVSCLNICWPNIVRISL